MNMAEARPESGTSSEWLHCVCCGNNDTEQRLLTCFHPCCVPCLQVASTVEGGVTCPKCFSVTVIMDTRQLQSNFLQNVEQRAATLMEPKVCTICKPSGKVTVGTHMCLECGGAHFCQECIKTHSYILATRSHKPVALSESSLTQANEAAKSIQYIPTCPKHHTDIHPQPLNFYCTPCQETLCETCWSEEHQTGKHQVIKLSQLSREKCQLIDQEASTLKEQIKALESTIIDYNSRLAKKKTVKEGLCNEVKRRTAGFKQAIDHMCQSYLHQIDTFFAEETNLLLNRIEEMEKHILKLKSIVGFSTTFQSACSEGAVVKHHGFVDNGLQHTKSEAEALPEQLPERSASLDTPAISVTLFRAEDFLGALTTSSMFAHAVQQEQINVCTAWSVDVESVKIIYGLDFSSGEIFIVGDPPSGCQNYIHTYGESGDKTRSIEIGMTNTWDLAVHADNILVSNCETASVAVMDIEGKIKRTISPLPDTTGEFISVAVGRSGVIYATTGEVNTLLRYTAGADDPEELVCAKNNLCCPVCVCLSPQEDLVISNDGSLSVGVFDQQGKLKFNYGSEGSDDGQLSDPRGVCSDSAGHIYIADRGNHRVSVITPSGDFLVNVVTKAHGVQRPHCVGINPQGTLLAVTHSDNKLTVFKIQ